MHRCSCYEDPCKAANCTSTETCRVEAYRDPITQEARYTARCEQGKFSKLYQSNNKLIFKIGSDCPFFLKTFFLTKCIPLNCGKLSCCPSAYSAQPDRYQRFNLSLK